MQPQEKATYDQKKGELVDFLKEKNIFKIINSWKDCQAFKSEDNPCYLDTSGFMISLMQKIGKKVNEKIEEMCEEEQKKRKYYLVVSNEKRNFEMRIKKQKKAVQAIDKSKGDVLEPRLMCNKCFTRETAFGMQVLHQPCCENSLCIKCTQQMELENDPIHQDRETIVYFKCPFCDTKNWRNSTDSKIRPNEFKNEDSHQKIYIEGIVQFLFHPC